MGIYALEEEKNTDTAEWYDVCEAKRKNWNRVHSMSVTAQLLPISHCAKIPYQYTYAPFRSANTISSVGCVTCTVIPLLEKKKVSGKVWDLRITDNNDYHGKHY